ncbi:MAG: IS630 family transposase [Magnetococcales bacterium]|nr:IS630 family transposase [Magnetococcales bacterium]
MLFFGSGRNILACVPARCRQRCKKWKSEKPARYAERNNAKRMWYLQELRILRQKHGKEHIVYFDESGFEQNVNRTHGWAARGRRIHGDIPGRGHRRTNLIMAQRNGTWLAPLLFDHSCTAALVNAWIENVLLPELTVPSVVVMDNATFHNKETIRGILEQHGHTLLHLPPYSPDFNPIEQSFATLKKRRLSTQPPTPPEDLLVCQP